MFISINIVSKILVVHTEYRNFGGEDVAVKNEIDFLSKNHEVRGLFFSNNNKLNFTDATIFLTQNDIKATIALNKTLDDFRPDIAYIHNLWFRGSLNVLNVLLNKNIKSVIKLHNFRFDCANGLHFRDNQICHDCSTSNRKPGIKNRCYNNSWLKSLFVTNYGKSLYDFLLKEKVEVLVMTDFHKQYLIKNGISSEKIHISPNMFPEVNFKSKRKQSNNNNEVLYAGRLSQEKGIIELIDFWINNNISNYKLIIAGDGPLKKQIKFKIRNISSIEYLGFKSSEEINDIILNSLAIISNTQVYENHPTLLTEASLRGVVSIFPNLGGIKYFLPEHYPLLFESGNYQSLMAKINLLADKVLLKKLETDVNSHINIYLNNNNLNNLIEKFIT